MGSAEFSPDGGRGDGERIDGALVDLPAADGAQSGVSGIGEPIGDGPAASGDKSFEERPAANGAPSGESGAGDPGGDGMLTPWGELGIPDESGGARRCCSSSSEVTRS